MKKPICFLLSATLILTLLAGCKIDDAPPETGATQPSVGEVTDPTQSTQSSEAVAQVGDVLDAPEKTVSVAGVEALTVAVSTASSYGVQRKITYAIRDAGGCLTLYARNTEKDLLAEDLYGYETICFVEGDSVRAYTNGSISGKGFTRVVDDGAGEDAELRGALANLGFDYGQWIETDGFTKCEDTTVLGKACYVYEVAYTDLFGAAYKAEICVDKQTGIWLRSQRSIVGSEDSFLMEVTSLEDSTATIPGTANVSLQEQAVYDKDGIGITAKDLDFSDPDHAVLVLEVRNDTDGDIRLSSHYLDIDGLCIGGNLINHTCAAGQTQQVRVELQNSALDRAGIQVIGKISFALWIDRVHTEPSLEGDYVVVDQTLVGDTGELVIHTDRPEGEGQTVDKTGLLLNDSDEVYLALKGVTVEDSGNAWFSVYCEDRCAEPIRVSVYISAINDIPCDLQGRVVMQERSEGFAGFQIYRNKLAELGVDQIRSVELCFEVFLGDSFMSTECIVERSEVMTWTVG